MSFLCHVLDDPPASGAWNMALDEALLESVAEENTDVWLRFYEWNEPTLSLGYFQAHAPWRTHVAADCAIVRRQTGGGAILHDRELTYSLVLPPRHPLARGGEALYRPVHEALLAALAQFGITAGLWPAATPLYHPAEEPYLCFERRARCDVVLWSNRGSDPHKKPGDDVCASPWRLGYKICGSAQRRSKGALLMHGSLLLAASPVTPQLVGITELTGRALSRQEISGAWLEELVRRLALSRTREAPRFEAFRRRAAHLEEIRYSAASWTTRR